MRFLVVSDIHARVDMVGRLMLKTSRIGGILVAGDITHFGGYTEAARVMNSILAAQIPVAAVAGNCDTDGVEEYLTDKKINIGGHYLRLGEFICIGVGGSLPCPKTTPREFGDNVLETVLSESFRQTAQTAPHGQGDSLIVVSHQPAFGTKVDSIGGRNAGSPAIRKFIDIHRPILAVSGHLHEAFGVDTIGSTTLVNPGPLKEGRYAVVEINGKNVHTELCLLD
jgi:Icc-related predicted phosphoesterase